MQHLLHTSAMCIACCCVNPLPSKPSYFLRDLDLLHLLHKIFNVVPTTLNPAPHATMRTAAMPGGVPYR
jgi:hypothetical protein